MWPGLCTGACQYTVRKVKIRSGRSVNDANLPMNVETNTQTHLVRHTGGTPPQEGSRDDD